MAKPVTFEPNCPYCNNLMEQGKGSALGSLHCKHCKGEFWDEIELTDLRPIPGPELPCPRCHLPMPKFKDNAWFCSKCDSQFWLDAVPEAEKIIDQRINVKVKHLSVPDGGFRTYMKAKNNKYHSSKGKSHKDKPKFERFYYFDQKN